MTDNDIKINNDSIYLNASQAKNPEGYEPINHW
jgi:hypothetical protein